MNKIFGFFSNFIPTKTESNGEPSNSYVRLHDKEDEKVAAYVNQILYKVYLEWQQKVEKDLALNEILANIEIEVERCKDLISQESDSCETVEEHWPVNETSLNSYIDCILSRVYNEVLEEMEQRAQRKSGGRRLSNIVPETEIPKLLPRSSRSCVLGDKKSASSQETEDSNCDKETNGISQKTPKVVDSNDETAIIASKSVEQQIQALKDTIDQNYTAATDGIGDKEQVWESESLEVCERIVSDAIDWEDTTSEQHTAEELDIMTEILEQSSFLPDTELQKQSTEEARRSARGHIFETEVNDTEATGFGGLSSARGDIVETTANVSDGPGDNDTKGVLVKEINTEFIVSELNRVSETRGETPEKQSSKTKDKQSHDSIGNTEHGGGNGGNRNTLANGKSTDIERILEEFTSLTLPQSLLKDSKTEGRSNVQVIEEVLLFVGEALTKLNHQLKRTDGEQPRKSDSNQTLRPESPTQVVEESSINNTVQVLPKTIDTGPKESTTIPAIEGSGGSVGSIQKDKLLKVARGTETDVKSKSISSLPPLSLVDTTKCPSLESTKVTKQIEDLKRNYKGQSDSSLLKKSSKTLELKSGNSHSTGNTRATDLEAPEDKLKALSDCAAQTDVHLHKSMEKWLAKRKNVKPPEVPKYVFKKPKAKGNVPHRAPIWERSNPAKVVSEEASFGENSSSGNDNHGSLRPRCVRRVRNLKFPLAQDTETANLLNNEPQAPENKAKGDSTMESDLTNVKGTVHSDENPDVEIELKPTPDVTSKDQIDETQEISPVDSNSYLNGVNFETEGGSTNKRVSTEKNLIELTDDEPVSSLIISPSNSHNTEDQIQEVQQNVVKETFSSEQSNPERSCDSTEESNSTEEIRKKNLDKVNAILQRARTRKSRATHPLISKQTGQSNPSESDSENTNTPNLSEEVVKVESPCNATVVSTRRCKSMREASSIPDKTTSDSIKQPLEKITELKAKTTPKGQTNKNAKNLETLHGNENNSPFLSKSKIPTLKAKVEPSAPKSILGQLALSPTPTKVLKQRKMVIDKEVKKSEQPISDTTKSEKNSSTDSVLVRGLSKHKQRMAKKSVPVVLNPAEEKFQKLMMKSKKKKHKKTAEPAKAVKSGTTVLVPDDEISIEKANPCSTPIDSSTIVKEQVNEVPLVDNAPSATDDLAEKPNPTELEVVEENLIDLESFVQASEELPQVYPEKYILKWLRETEFEQRLEVRQTVGRDYQAPLRQSLRPRPQIPASVRNDEQRSESRLQHVSNNNRYPEDDDSEAAAISGDDIDFNSVFGNGNLLQLYLEFQREYSRLFRLEIRNNPFLQMLISCQNQQCLEVIPETSCGSRSRKLTVIEEEVCSHQTGVDLTGAILEKERISCGLARRADYLNHFSAFGISHYLRPKHIFPNEDEDDYRIHLVNKSEDLRTKTIVKHRKSFNSVSFLQELHICNGEEDIDESHRMVPCFEGEWCFVEKKQDRNYATKKSRRKKRFPSLTKFLLGKIGLRKAKAQHKIEHLQVNMEGDENGNANETENCSFKNFDLNGFQMCYEGKRARLVARIMQYQTHLWFMRQRRRG